MIWLKIEDVFINCKVAFAHQKKLYSQFPPTLQIKNPPLHIRLWFNVAAALTSLRLLGHPTRRGKPMLYSYQGAMPAMPLPSVQDTLRR